MATVQPTAAQLLAAPSLGGAPPGRCLLAAMAFGIHLQDRNSHLLSPACMLRPSVSCLPACAVSNGPGLHRHFYEHYSHAACPFNLLIQNVKHPKLLENWWSDGLRCTLIPCLMLIFWCAIAP